MLFWAHLITPRALYIWIFLDIPPYKIWKLLLKNGQIMPILVIFGFIGFCLLWCVCRIGYHAKSETYTTFFNLAILTIFGLVGVVYFGLVTLVWYDKLRCRWSTTTPQLLMISVKRYKMFLIILILKTCSKKNCTLFFGNLFWKYFCEGQSEIPWKIWGL